METKITCPLGSQCEEAKDGALYRCAWYTKLVGHDPQTDQPIDEWRCAIQWLPLMQVENTGQQHRTGKAIESFRNEMVTQNQQMLQVMSTDMPIVFNLPASVQHSIDLQKLESNNEESD